MTKTLSGGGDLARGDISTYELRVNNNGNLASDRPAHVTDTLPAGLSYVAASGTGWSCDFAGGTLSCDHAAAIDGNDAAEPIALDVRVSASAPGSITNTATVDTRGDSNGANDSDGATANVSGVAPDLALSMSKVGSFRNGSNGTFALSIRNVGSGPTTGPSTVSLTISGATVAGGSGSGWSCSGTTCTHATPIAAGARTDLDLDVNIDKGTLLLLTSASVATAGDPESANDTASDATLTTKIDAQAAISHSGALAVGQPGSFAVTATNAGSAATVGTTVMRVTLPDAFDYVSASGSGWTCTPSGNDAVCEHPGAIAAGASAGFDLLAKPLVGGSAQVTATVATEDDVNAANDAATDSADVGGGPGGALQLKKGKVKVPKSGRVAVPATCAAGGGACSGTLTLTVKGKKVGSGNYQLAAGQSSTVTVKLTKKARKQLAKKGKLKVVATAGDSTAKLKLKYTKKKG